MLLQYAEPIGTHVSVPTSVGLRRQQRNIGVADRRTSGVPMLARPSDDDITTPRPWRQTVSAAVPRS